MTQYRAVKSSSIADGLPAPLPAGERIIWQGRPSAKGLALRAFHVREVAIYFGLMVAWRLGSGMAAGASADEVFLAASWLVVPAVAAIGVLFGLAYAFARATRYTLTSKRVLLQFGVALPMTLNVPLDKIAGAALKTYRDKSGDIPLALTESKASFLVLWPHVRPWRLQSVQPMLRAVPEAAQVAAKLAEALTGDQAPAALAIRPATAERIYAVPGAAVAA